MKKKSWLLAVLPVISIVSLLSCNKNEPEPEALNIMPMVATIGPEGGDVKFSITGDGSWEIELAESTDASSEWCTLDVMSGEGAHELVATISPAVSAKEKRSVVIKVIGEERTLSAKVIQDPVALEPGEVLINGLIWSTRNVGEPGKFVEDIEDCGMYYMFNSKTPWSPDVDPAEYKAAVAAYDASQAPSDPNAEIVTNDLSVERANFWKEENNPCPEGWRVPMGWEVIQIMGNRNTELEDPTEGCFFHRVEAGTQGFDKLGFIVGLDKNLAKTATKETVEEMGGMFIPVSGWINEEGLFDRDWLVTLRTATWLNDTMAGMYISDLLFYDDPWGWGDGQKVRAAPVRCVKK